MDPNVKPQTEKKPLDPVDKVLRLRGNAEPRNQTFIAKIYLRKFGEVELHSFGQATKNAVRVAENLERTGLVTISSVKTLTETLEGGRKVKMIVHLTVTEEGKARIAQQIQK